MFGQAVRGQDVREAVVGRGRIFISRARTRVGGRIGLARRMDWVADRRFEWLVVRGEGAIVEPGRNPDPTEAVGVQDERLVSRECVVTFGARLRLVIGRLRGYEIGDIEAGPSMRGVVPPDEFFSVAPRFAVRPGGGAIV